MSTTSPTIMIVEDNLALRQLYGRILASKGYVILNFSENGEDAIEFYKSISEYPGIILMDYRMPLKDGLTASKEILGINPNQKIIIVSADTSIQINVSEHRNVQFLKKPFNIAELLNKILDMTTLFDEGTRSAGSL